MPALATAPAGILEKLQGNGRPGRWGVCTASRYLRELAAEQESDLEDAGEKLIYCGEDMQIVDSSREKAKTTASPDNAIMVFDAVITSRAKDRDGDVLEPAGAVIDERSPLLWQHDSTHPIGKLLDITNRSKQRIKGRFAIIDTELGRDAAALIDFGVLRISHGFIPEEYDELTDKQGNWLGWHILKYEMLEISVVSVPSNRDAIITAFESNKLCHPRVKSWAQRISKSRPVQVPATVAPDTSKQTEADAPPEPTETPRPEKTASATDEPTVVAAQPSTMDILLSASQDEWDKAKAIREANDRSRRRREFNEGLRRLM